MEPLKKSSCDFCNFKCSTKAEFLNHFCRRSEYQEKTQDKSDNNLIECNFCGQFFQNSNRFYDLHTKNCHGRLCEFCNVKCATNAEYLNHICRQSQYQEKTEDMGRVMLPSDFKSVNNLIKCEICGRFFQNYDSLYEHHTKNCLALVWQELKNSHPLVMSSESYR